jgi:hypothetical protein
LSGVAKRVDPATHLRARSVVDRSGCCARLLVRKHLRRSQKAAKIAKISKIAKGKGDWVSRLRGLSSVIHSEDRPDAQAVRIPSA